MKSAKASFLFSCALIISTFCQNSLAWITRGHLLVAQIAYDNLSPRNQDIALQYADQLVSHLSYYQQHQLYNDYRRTNNFVRIAGLPDFWRNLTLKEIFNKFHAPLPSSLLPYANDTTDAWHFIDTPYQHHCPQLRKENIVWALNLLKKSWAETNNVDSKAVIMAFIEHLVADIHQPLHTFTRVNFICYGDSGGNAYPVYVGKTLTNLHKVWDSGVGYLNNSFSYPNRAARLQEEFPKNLLATQLQDTNPQEWAKANLIYADFIYSIGKNKHLYPNYYREGQLITRRQITLAGYRLGILLNNIMSQNKLDR